MCVEKHVVSRIPDHHDEIAARNRALFKALGLTVINFMSAPGAGKTSLLEQTLPEIQRDRRVGVIEGDLCTDDDASRIRAAGIPAHQITTGSVCHLDARMIQNALHHFPVHGLDLLCIENVGNMVCPAEFDLGEHLRVMVYSTTEGPEKPRKYPLMFRRADVIVLNKLDLLPMCGLCPKELYANVRAVNAHAAIFPVSCRTGEGMEPWKEWLSQVTAEHQKPALVVS
jgi:hydrogenase nickel incorporation protein HypB